MHFPLSKLLNFISTTGRLHDELLLAEPRPLVSGRKLINSSFKPEHTPTNSSAHAHTHNTAREAQPMSLPVYVSPLIHARCFCLTRGTTAWTVWNTNLKWFYDLIFQPTVLIPPSHWIQSCRVRALKVVPSTSSSFYFRLRVEALAHTETEKHPVDFNWNSSHNSVRRTENETTR